jgi:hypothetical protein
MGICPEPDHEFVGLDAGTEGFLFSAFRMGHVGLY